MSDVPNYLFLIGAPKCSTTTVANWLGTHQDIVVSSTKESRFFTDFATRYWRGPGTDHFVETLAKTPSDYDALFAHKPGVAWRVDASTDYLSCPASPGLIAEFAKNHRVKVVAILRDPVQRVISEFQHTLRDSYQAGTLEQSLKAETARITDGQHPLFYHIYRSNYAEQIARYRDAFGDDLTVLDFHTMNEGHASYDRIMNVMGLDPHPKDDAPHLNKSYAPRSRLIADTIRHPTVRAMAQAIMPKSMGVRLKDAVEKVNKTTYEVTEREMAILRDSLAPIVEACLANDAIPTQNWKTACPEMA